MVMKKRAGRATAKAKADKAKAAKEGAAAAAAAKAAKEAEAAAEDEEIAAAEEEAAAVAASAASDEAAEAAAEEEAVAAAVAAATVEATADDGLKKAARDKTSSASKKKMKQAVGSARKKSAPNATEAGTGGMAISEAASARKASRQLAMQSRNRGLARRTAAVEVAESDVDTLADAVPPMHPVPRRKLRAAVVKPAVSRGGPAESLSADAATELRQGHTAAADSLSLGVGVRLEVETAGHLATSSAAVEPDGPGAPVAATAAAAAAATADGHDAPAGTSGGAPGLQKTGRRRKEQQSAAEPAAEPAAAGVAELAAVRSELAVRLQGKADFPVLKQRLSPLKHCLPVVVLGDESRAADARHSELSAAAGRAGACRRRRRGERQNDPRCPHESLPHDPTASRFSMDHRAAAGLFSGRPGWR